LAWLPPSYRAPQTPIQEAINSNQLFEAWKLILANHQVLTTKRISKPAEGEIMKPSTEDVTVGKIHEVKGAIREVAGKATNDPDLEVAGNAEKNAGTVQKWVGRAEKAVGE
jgi:uncharacterized protein YjbJ (UPF0337 family)